ncbi:MAG: hypothetical protein HOM68_17005 [Gemmatimonadetes bacterium]|jgi:hypothetical protein|nr:hypothetical protein [Gemmatimonadota bacterium]MBT4611841.1 hypothetical protein [Gemmatimonadota bacterium]MBT5058243.1 hypothetical protein [Gemmatimonadota bacterium]MBT5142320.1 hypothetical protein [Gemmatimonadota bacterium]MBT5589095.1 hypothetical protein [Gemmatimonadota bacterium]
MKAEECILYSGGAGGAEAEFGANAERLGIDEVNFSFEGHNHVRDRGLRILNHEELLSGDISLAYVSKLMNRRYSEGPAFRKVLQTIWHQINNGQEVFVIGEILEDNTVKGGTGWGAEFAKLCNKPLHVFDQIRASWYTWSGAEWIAVEGTDEPIIQHIHFTGTGSRHLSEAGVQAIGGLYDRSF